MKTYKLILSALALVAVLSVNAFAQVAADTDVVVTATVVTGLSIAKTDVAFGNINSGSAAVLKANGSDTATEANIGSFASAGSVTITGNSGSTVLITFTTATLANAAGDVTAVFTPSIWNAGAISTGDSITLTGGTSVLDIGGSLASIAAAGSYSTGNTNGVDLNIAVEYN